MTQTENFSSMAELSSVVDAKVAQTPADNEPGLDTVDTAEVVWVSIVPFSADEVRFEGVQTGGPGGDKIFLGVAQVRLRVGLTAAEAVEWSFSSFITMSGNTTIETNTKKETRLQVKKPWK